jgi:hypothetical protein
VIGAGPAGIAVVGKLLDHGIPAQEIGWMDPYFEVGDLGKKWLQVSSNTKVDLFIKFLEDCKSFHYKRSAKEFSIDALDPHTTCLLKEIALPLQSITHRLLNHVKSFVCLATGLNLKNNVWEVKTDKEIVFAKNVILTTGCDPKKLHHAHLEEIPLDVALNPEILSSCVCRQDTVAVFGSSHSAILILANLVNINANVINFYRSPLLYAVDMGDWLLFDNTGLKGYAASWAKKHLDGTLPKNLQRILSTDHTSEEILAKCNKAVYAVGFKRRKLPILEQYSDLDYNNKTGIIAPGLFGFGIAFPEMAYDRMMNLEHRVGLWKFMEYLNKVLPIWIKYSH